MKKITFPILLLLCGQLVFGQINTVTKKSVTPIKPGVNYMPRIIPAAKATSIRKNVKRLTMQLTQLSDSVAIVKKDIDNAEENIKNKLDSMSEMGEMESLRLQMAMDRLSKMMTTLSNLLKKISDTNQGITQNIK